MISDCHRVSREKFSAPGKLSLLTAQLPAPQDKSRPCGMELLDFAPGGSIGLPELQSIHPLDAWAGLPHRGLEPILLVTLSRKRNLDEIRGS